MSCPSVRSSQTSIEQKSFKDGECTHPGLENVRSYSSRWHNVNYDNFTPEGKFLYREEMAKKAPDKAYVHMLQNDLQHWSYKFRRLSKRMTISCLMLDDRLNYLSWFSSTTRQRFIRLVGDTLKSQNGVECLTAEFGVFLQDDALLFLLAVALGGGQHLKSLHLWRLFKPGQLPVHDLPGKPLILEAFIAQMQTESPDELMKKYLWRSFLEKANFATLEEKLMVFYASLKCFTNLTVLSVEYSFLAAGQGDALQHLACINAGSLRRLNLLYTESEDPMKTQRYISKEAWEEAVKKNPSLRVNLVAIRTADFDSLSRVLTSFLPLEKIYASSGLGVSALREGLRFDLTTRLLMEYKDHLKCITLSFHNPDYAVDLSIRKCLVQLPLLEEFEYRGPMDRLFVLPELLDEILSINGITLRRLHFYLPANETSFQTVETYYSEFEHLFKERGIDFQLKTCCI